MAARGLGIASIFTTLLACGSALLACGDPGPESLVIVSLDTVRRDHLSTYGYARKTSPHLDALAEESLVFEGAFAQHVNTHPSHASMFTGLYPNVHGSIYNGMRLPAGRATLAQLLVGAGFRTAAFVSGATMVAQTGLDRGFEVYDDSLGGARRDGGATVALALDWLGQRIPGERFFLFVHLFDAHGPYTFEDPPRFRSTGPGPELVRIPAYQRLRDESGQLRVDLNEYVDRYDSLIHYSDDQLGKLLAALDLDTSVVVVLSDHGETLGERHHSLDHGGQTTDEQIRIPLIMSVPRQRGRRLADLVETVDLVPTLLELLGVPAPEALEVQGRSLVPLILGPEVESAPERAVFSSALALAPRHADRGYRFELGGQIHSLRTERWKLVRYPGTDGEVLELYDLARDPGELENRADSEPALRDEYLGRLERWMSQGPLAHPPAEISPELRSYLLQLGYGEP